MIRELAYTFAESFISRFASTLADNLATRLAAALDDHNMEKRMVESITSRIAARRDANP